MKLERATADQIGGHIGTAAGDDLTGILDEIRQGIAEAWRVDEGAAWLVTRIEGRELVVVCFEGRDLLRLTRDLFTVARQQGLETIRAHAKHRGIFRMFRMLGAQEAERVYRLRL